MCESLVGGVNPATRQNCGNPVIVCGGTVGVTNVPAGTVCAVVIVVFGRWKLVANCEHVNAAAGDAANIIPATAIVADRYREACSLIILAPPLFCAIVRPSSRDAYSIASSDTKTIAPGNSAVNRALQLRAASFN